MLKNQSDWSLKYAHVIVVSCVDTSDIIKCENSHECVVHCLTLMS